MIRGASEEARRNRKRQLRATEMSHGNEQRMKDVCPFVKLFSGPACGAILSAHYSAMPEHENVQ